MKPVSRFAFAFIAWWMPILLLSFTAMQAAAQEEERGDAAPGASVDTVAVEEVAADAEIEKRLQSILDATEWFREVEVESDQGIVTLSGKTPSEEHRLWAEALALRTQDVVNVKNSIEVTTTLDFSSSWEVVSQSLYKIWQDFLRRLPLVLAGLVVLLSTWGLSRISRQALRRVLIRARRMRPSLKDLLLLLASIGIWVGGLLVAAVVVFPGMTPARALTFLGIGSVAIGFAFKDIFENFFAGVLILWRYPLEKGDIVQVGETVGEVEDITVRNTFIRRLDGELTVVPNATIFKQEVDVITNRETRRVRLTCGVAYGEDVGAAREVIERAVQSCSSVRQDQPIHVLADCFADSSINFEVFWWTGAKPMQVRSSRDEVLTAIKLALDAAGIEIPFPYRTLTFKHPLAIQQREAMG